MNDATEQNSQGQKLSVEFVRSFESKEPRAGEHLTAKLEHELALLAQARELIVRACAHVDEVNQQNEPSAREMACAMLSVRLINDARAIAVVIGHGYLQQAIAVATAMSDAAFSLAAVAGDDDLAVKWINHEDFRESVIFTKRAIRRACERVRYVKNIDGQVKFFWDAYQFLSSVKHGNPRFLKRLDLQNVDAEMLTVSVGPSASIAAQAVGTMALLFCHQILLFAARAHLEGFPNNPALLDDIEVARHTGMQAIERLRHNPPATWRRAQNDRRPPATRYDANGVAESHASSPRSDS